MVVSRNMITGITGQDGILLSKLLHNKDEEVFGIVTQESDKHRVGLLKRVLPQIELVEISSLKRSSLMPILRKRNPDKIFNFAALSSVKRSFEDPELTMDINYRFFCDLVEAAVQECDSTIRIFQSSSSEMFGNSVDDLQGEDTAFQPLSPYGESKLLSHMAARDYRNSGIFVTSGILFNHESEYRKDGFLIEKITSYMANRKMGKKEILSVGNLALSRDWGYAGDFVKGIYDSLQAPNPDEFVFATGEERTIREVIQLAMNVIEDFTSIEEIIEFRPDLSRKSEKLRSKGDFSKAKKILGWSPSIEFSNMLRLIIDYKITNSK